MTTTHLPDDAARLQDAAREAIHEAALRLYVKYAPELFEKRPTRALDALDSTIDRILTIYVTPDDDPRRILCDAANPHSLLPAAARLALYGELNAFLSSLPCQIAITDLQAALTAPLDAAEQSIPVRGRAA